MSQFANYFSTDVVIPGEKKLRPICKDLGLPQKGSKIDLVRRLTTHGLTLEEIVDRAKHCIAPPRRNLADELLQLRQQSAFYANALPPSIDDVPGEKSLRNVCKRFALKQYGTKLDLVKRLLGHGLSFGDILASSATPPFLSSSSSSNVMNTAAALSPSIHRLSSSSAPPPETIETIDVDDYEEEVNFIREMARLDAIED